MYSLRIKKCPCHMCLSGKKVPCRLTEVSMLNIAIYFNLLSFHKSPRQHCPRSPKKAVSPCRFKGFKFMGIVLISTNRLTMEYLW